METNATIKTLIGIVQKVVPSTDNPLLRTLTIDGVDYVNVSREGAQDWASGDRVTFSAGMRYLPSNTVSCLNAWHVHAVIAMPAYKLPSKKVHTDWAGYEAKDFTPDGRQLMVMQACSRAIAAGVFYTSEMYEHIIRQLNIDPSLLSIYTASVEGGDVGMDIYYARGALRAAEKRASIQKAHDKLKPVEGMVIGTLDVGSKKTTVCVITKVNGFSLQLTAKRGRSPVSFACNSKQLVDASVDAFNKGWRVAPICKA